MAGVVGVVAVLLSGCGSGGSSGEKAGDENAPVGESTTTVAARPLRILVTNDDGVGAPGIDALVNGLKGSPGVEVTVVAPATNQSGAGGKVTDGTLTATKTTTASGYPATAVAGTPADTVVWAIDQKGIDFTPDLVIAGINAGQNMGPVIDVSGTVGAARAAAKRGIPALAASQGGLAPPNDWPSGVSYVLEWLDSNLAPLKAHALATTTVANLNIPTCPAGKPRGKADVPLATSGARYGDIPDCQSTAPVPADDIAAFLVGFAPLSQIPATAGSTG